jgi:hypothetical protein
VKRHGADAAMVAAQRADELLATGDIELSRTRPATDERFNRWL